MHSLLWLLYNNTTPIITMYYVCLATTLFTKFSYRFVSTFSVCALCCYNKIIRDIAFTLKFSLKLRSALNGFCDIISNRHKILRLSIYVPHTKTLCTTHIAFPKSNHVIPKWNHTIEHNTKLYINTGHMILSLYDVIA